MTRKNGNFTIEEGGGDRYPTLAAAQQMALKPIAAELSRFIQELLENQVLIIEGGRIEINLNQEVKKNS